MFLKSSWQGRSLLYSKKIAGSNPASRLKDLIRKFYGKKRDYNRKFYGKNKYRKQVRCRFGT